MQENNTTSISSAIPIFFLQCYRPEYSVHVRAHKNITDPRPILEIGVCVFDIGVPARLA